MSYVSSQPTMFTVVIVTESSVIELGFFGTYENADAAALKISREMGAVFPETWRTGRTGVMVIQPTITYPIYQHGLDNGNLD